MDRRDALLTMLSTAAFAAGGCSGGAGKRIAVIPKGTSHDFWKSVHYGAESAAKGSDYAIAWKGTNSEKNKGGQIRIVESFIRQKVSGICLAPIDRDALIKPVQRAKENGIPTVIFDSGLSDLSGVVSYVATNNYQGGVMAGEQLAKLMNEKGGVILLRYQAGSESTEQREKGFLETIAKYPGIKVLDSSQRVDSGAGSAKKKAGPLLKKHRAELTGVFTVCEPNNKGMLEALTDAKLAGKVKFVAFDSDPRMIDGLKAGTVHGVVLQDPVKMGATAVKTMLQYLDGKKEGIKKKINTGEFLATRENMTEKKYAALLSPKQFDD